MAGIGFELQRVLREGGVLAFLKVTIAGAVIVAGPWLLSVLGIFTITRVAGSALSEASRLFTATIGYSFATSLILFGGMQYVFTRHVADLIYEERFSDACGVMVAYLGLTTLAAVAIGVGALAPMEMAVVSRPVLFKAALVGLFVAINLIWLLMIFASLLKRYLLIFAVYLVGMAGSTLGVIWLGGRLQLGGAMLGFAGGQLFIALTLLLLIRIEYRPSFAAVRQIGGYFRRQRVLFFTGLLYNWAIWADKVVLWFTRGEAVEGTVLRTFDAYDIPFFFANLTMIPGLIYFVIQAETSFYRELMGFLDKLGGDPLRMLRQRKASMVRVLRMELSSQMLLQGVCTAAVVFFAAEIARALFGGAVEAWVLQTTTVAVLAHLGLLTVLIFLFYLEEYGYALLAATIFLALNVAGAFATLGWGVPAWGLSYLVSAALASAFGTVVLFARLRVFDRVIFARSASG